MSDSANRTPSSQIRALGLQSAEVELLLDSVAAHTAAVVAQSTAELIEDAVNALALVLGSRVRSGADYPVPEVQIVLSAFRERFTNTALAPDRVTRAADAVKQSVAKPALTFAHRYYAQGKSIPPPAPSITYSDDEDTNPGIPSRKDKR